MKAPRARATGQESHAGTKRPPETAGADRAALLLDHAHDLDDVVCFSEQMPDGRWSYLDRFDIPDVRPLGVEEFAKQRYGGGKYRAALRARSSGVWGQSVVINIAGPRRSDAERNADSAPAATLHSSSSSSAPPDWVKTVVMPIMTTLGVSIAGAIGKRFLEPAKPATDPALVKLIETLGKARDRGDGVGALELQRLLLDAEQLGERRGKELGELRARADGESGAGVGSVVRDAMPLFTRLADIAERNAGGASAPQLPAPPSATEPRSPTTAAPAAAVPPTAPDIVPAWLRPFMHWRSMIVQLADQGKDAGLYADLVVDQASGAVLAEIRGADDAGTLERDLFAAVPELQVSPAREQFARELLEAVRAGILELEQADADETPDARSSSGGH